MQLEISIQYENFDTYFVSSFLYIATENINLYNMCYLPRIYRSFVHRLSITKPQRNIAKQN